MTVNEAKKDLDSRVRARERNERDKSQVRKKTGKKTWGNTKSPRAKIQTITPEFLMHGSFAAVLPAVLLCLPVPLAGIVMRKKGAE